MQNLILCLIIIFLFSFNLNAELAVKSKIQCLTGAMLTTSYSLLESNSGDFELHAIHHNGVKYAPIHSGTITSSDFNYLKKKSKVIINMGESFIVKFNKNECQFKPEHTICHTNRSITVGKESLSSFGFSLFKETLNNPYGEFSNWNFRTYMNSKKNPVVYHQTMDYQPNDCIFN